MGVLREQSQKAEYRRGSNQAAPGIAPRSLAEEVSTKNPVAHRGTSITADMTTSIEVLIEGSVQPLLEMGSESLAG
ncbi:hypothetical protein HPB48_020200 [Haemaphysalis longicornis]|uniref:Uncharacterized protein n=1 Tax=Haemaphysalis longicornis TaxID=44386 RepID=A0A9J6G7Q7_HAELO|nr:hypothetical protein HPB48_020200 [Haemaphysalis longicornis]